MRHQPVALQVNVRIAGIQWADEESRARARTALSIPEEMVRDLRDARGAATSWPTFSSDRKASFDLDLRVAREIHQELFVFDEKRRELLRERETSVPSRARITVTAGSRIALIVASKRVSTAALLYRARAECRLPCAGAPFGVCCRNNAASVPRNHRLPASLW